MKKTVLTIVLFSIIGAMSAQIKALYEETYLFVLRAEAHSFESDYLPDDYNGSPYFDYDFLPGTLYENNNIMASNYLFRYNAIQDEVEVKPTVDTPNSEMKILARSPEIYVKGANYLFVFNENTANPALNGYFQVLVVGNSFNLYKKLNKNYYPARKARNSFEKDVLATYTDAPIYYIVDGAGKFYEVPGSKNKKANVFGNKKDEINKFVKHSDLDLSEEKDFVKAFKYFDSFDDASL